MHLLAYPVVSKAQSDYYSIDSFKAQLCTAGSLDVTKLAQ